MSDTQGPSQEPVPAPAAGADATAIAQPAARQEPAQEEATTPETLEPSPITALPSEDGLRPMLRKKAKVRIDEHLEQAPLASAPPEQAPKRRAMPVLPTLSAEARALLADASSSIAQGLRKRVGEWGAGIGKWIKKRLTKKPIEPVASHFAVPAGAHEAQHATNAVGELAQLEARMARVAAILAGPQPKTHSFNDIKHVLLKPREIEMVGWREETEEAKEAYKNSGALRFLTNRAARANIKSLEERDQKLRDEYDNADRYYEKHPEGRREVQEFMEQANAPAKLYADALKEQAELAPIIAKKRREARISNARSNHVLTWQTSARMEVEAANLWQTAANVTSGYQRNNPLTITPQQVAAQIAVTQTATNADVATATLVGTRRVIDFAAAKDARNAAEPEITAPAPEQTPNQPANAATKAASSPTHLQPHSR